MGCVHRVITDLATLDVTPDGFKLVDLADGHTLEEVGLGGYPDRHGISVLAIRRGRTSFLHPARDEKIKPGDVLIVAGTNENVGRLYDMARELPSPVAAETGESRHSG